MNGIALMKHCLHKKKAASVLLKLFISGYKGCHTTEAPYCMSGTLFPNVNNIQSVISDDKKNITTQ